MADLLATVEPGNWLVISRGDSNAPDRAALVTRTTAAFVHTEHRCWTRKGYRRPQSTYDRERVLSCHATEAEAEAVIAAFRAREAASRELAARRDSALSDLRNCAGYSGAPADRLEAGLEVLSAVLGVPSRSPLPTREPLDQDAVDRILAIVRGDA